MALIEKRSRRWMATGVRLLWISLALIKADPTNFLEALAVLLLLE
jgi:hypothetical protein